MKKKRVLFFDDDKERHHLFKEQFDIYFNVDYAYNAKEAEQFILMYDYDIVSLDHDMDGEVYQPSTMDNGFGVAVFIGLMSRTLPKLAIVHSYNEHAAPSMVNVLQTSDVSSKWVPFNTSEYQLIFKEEMINS